ncbi:MAG TPA: glycerol-3-phosphate dehydrogenase/oxidase [Chloroflexia bacterium]|nr:glycerol-3-phosphate dehydrogenase/oxidase [Chloroflexia bacterium]
MGGRDSTWARVSGPWDVLVIGGGIMGAGILREAVRSGARALLVEQHDFAWGASGRSSNVVHGGFRYLMRGQLHLTHDAVRGRQELLAAGAGLVEPLGFLATDYGQGPIWRTAMRAGLAIYDIFAGYWRHAYHKAGDFQMLAPYIATEGLRGGFAFCDARTDDARLVWRVVQEAMMGGGVALNYARAEQLLWEGNRVVGVRLRDVACGQTAEVRARVVVNATGAWADEVRGEVGGQEMVRQLRGSHLVFPGWRVPVAQSITVYHPVDNRPVFVLPWEGRTLVGTTDLDHDQPLNDEPHITPDETAYLMAALEYLFPALDLTLEDVVSTYAGVRPVIGGKHKADPSSESREYTVVEERGLVTVTGGKLTTFHPAALDVLEVVRRHIPEMPASTEKQPVLDAVSKPQVGVTVSRRILGRHGNAASAMVRAAREGEWEEVPQTHTLWAEVRWAARAEAVMHLEDLMLRRTRLGLLLPRGGEALLPQIGTICREELGWDSTRWEAEMAEYMALWNASYSLPERGTIPDWRALLADALRARDRARQKRNRVTRRVLARATAGCAVVGALLLGSRYAWRARKRQARSRDMARQYE